MGTELELELFVKRHARMCLTSIRAGDPVVETPKTKHQAPEKLQASNPKRYTGSLKFGVRCFSGAWCLVLGAFIAFACSAQTNLNTLTSATVSANSPNPQSAALTNREPANNPPFTSSTNLDLRAEQIRAAGIQGRRLICGRILKILPDGLVVESGYTSLLRPELSHSWLVPGTIQASPDPHLVEGREPGDVATGLVFLTDIPKTRGLKPKAYDYVVIQAFPAGQYTYTSVGNIQRTIRRFACGLETAVRLTLEAGGETNSSPAGVH